MKELELLEKPNVDGVFWVIVTQTYATLNDLLLHHKTSSIYTFLFVAAVLQREVTLGNLKSAFMQSDEDVSDRQKGKMYGRFLDSAQRCSVWVC